MCIRDSFKNRNTFLSFMPTTAGPWHSKIRNRIKVVHTESADKSVDLSEESLYVPFDHGESLTITDQSSGHELTMGHTDGAYTLAVDGDPGDLGGMDNAGDVFTHVYDNMEYVVVWGSGTVGGSPVGGGVGDPYVATLTQ